MIDNYRSEIWRYYENKKISGDLSLNLSFPTAAKLRNECLLKFRKGLANADYRMLKSFLERPDNEEIYEAAIKRFDPDKFKPLNNFLKRGTKTDEKNIELLAWLIDFQPRPYSFYRFASNATSEIIANADPLTINSKEKKITLEYPSGVILSVDAYDINLISRLIRL